MIKWALEEFVNIAIRHGEISRADVLRLQRNICPDGIETRDEADVLIALDRAIHEKDPAWSAFVIQAVVDFVVWTSRPTGCVDRDTAEWLVGTLGCGCRPTEVAMAIAFDIVRESERSDERLAAFVMRWAGGRTQTRHEIEAYDIAA